MVSAVSVGTTTTDATISSSKFTIHIVYSMHDCRTLLLGMSVDTMVCVWMKGRGEGRDE